MKRFAKISIIVFVVGSLIGLSGYGYSIYQDLLPCKEVTASIQPDVVEKEVLVSTIKSYILSSNRKTYSNLAEEMARALAETDDPLFYTALAKRESSFNPFAVSKTGAIGILQISQIHIDRLKKKGIISSKRDLYNPIKNIKASQYLVNHVMKGKSLNQRLVKYLGATNKRYISDVKQNIGELYYLLNQQKAKTKTISHRVFAMGDHPDKS